MKTIIYINFAEMNNWDIEELISKFIATDLDEKKCSVTLATNNNVHRGVIEFSCKCAGVKIMGFLTAQNTFIGTEDIDMNYELDYFMI